MPLLPPAMRARFPVQFIFMVGSYPLKGNSIINAVDQPGCSPSQRGP
jgi:hypothetical protein